MSSTARAPAAAADQGSSTEPQWTLQELLTFLTKDAKIPLKDAMGYAQIIMKEKWNRPSRLLEAKLEGVKEKVTKGEAKPAQAILRAAKKITGQGLSPSGKKRPAESENTAGALKRSKTGIAFPALHPNPSSLSHISLTTNRAPLLLAYTLTLLSRTHPTLSLDSRLSIAQAYISANARSYGRDIGVIEGGGVDEKAEVEGFRKVQVMGRVIAVLGRSRDEGEEEEEEVRALDLDPNRVGMRDRDGQPAVCEPGGAWGYLARSFPGDALGQLLSVLEAVMESWCPDHPHDPNDLKADQERRDLDRRGYGLYTRIRPNVEYGKAGWGQKGEVQLGDILALRREEVDGGTRQVGIEEVVAGMKEEGDQSRSGEVSARGLNVEGGNVAVEPRPEEEAEVVKKEHGGKQMGIEEAVSHMVSVPEEVKQFIKDEKEEERVRPKEEVKSETRQLGIDEMLPKAEP
ncbi:hypothetical protein SAICODRAFT_4707 [Saitoella complicata NRRL Y-17804]|uniref:Uncharacterized protein n=1 Tax=Saitoella complicata (strain BCRC 22490 / CBS 7301 / JCM 7358 / NBRC 10748 / NRRL Y-17804) TaxID=698492 RepID=A0A0E9N9W9_SAICN|nr:uncharacterized protein SAICODRAFT_4707 [Saitoella complicata NRRL Y-17804]ODQ56529.1 hypothetical protein SAICODRAFT_4707 [Saitoella complicata NRRL Y-17804]GAO46496.1 hypothetical protein G7K_0727-t1 [Saitoella complicata NRRL Y-17804]